MGRTVYGVKAVTLDDEQDEVVSMVGVKRQATLLAVAENGYGKRSEIAEYRVSHRGAKGIITIKTNERNGDVVAVKEVVDGDELMIITRSGQLIRMPVQGISVIGRNTQGVRLVNLAPQRGEAEAQPDGAVGRDLRGRARKPRVARSCRTSVRALHGLGGLLRSAPHSAPAHDRPRHGRLGRGRGRARRGRLSGPGGGAHRDQRGQLGV